MYARVQSIPPYIEKYNIMYYNNNNKRSTFVIK